VTERKKILLRLDPAVHDALARWAGDELRSTNAQIEFLLRAALSAADRLPTGVRRIPGRGRPPKVDDSAAGERTDGVIATAGDAAQGTADLHPGLDTDTDTDADTDTAHGDGDGATPGAGGPE
jgi:hypothetical protein